MESEEQIQRNCEEIDELRKKYPNRTIYVFRTDNDKCRIREIGTKKLLFEGNTGETLIKFEEMLKAEQTKQIEEITKDKC